MGKDYLNPKNLPDWSDAFSQVVVVRNGSMRTVYVAGQVSVDAENRIVGQGDLAAQSQQAFQNLAIALSSADASAQDVVRLGIYVKDYQPEQAEVICEAMRKVFVGDELPVSTWLGVASLALDELLIEVDAIAVVACDEDGQPPR